MPNACHPFSTKDYFESNYVGVHNGVIWNDNVLEKQHQAIGINYVSRQPNGQFNDSEALIYDIARYLEGDVNELTAEGTIAFIVIKRNTEGKPVTLFFGRNSGNPLKMKRTNNSLTISSEGEGVDVKTNTLYSYDYETGNITERYMYIPSYRSNYGFSSSKTYQGYERGYVDDYYSADSGSDGEKYGITGVSSEDARSLINAGGFQGRTGGQTAIKNAILREQNGDYEMSAIAALIELEEASREMDRIDKAIYSPLSDQGYQDISDYWYLLSAYIGMLSNIARELEEEATVERVNNGVAKVTGAEVQEDGTLVFPSGISVSPAEQSLLPMGLS